jgi:glycosyltransferase involved in cell wall biosynthesis
MRIAIDVSPVVYETGVSVYTKNLVENLLRTDKKNEYVLFGGSLRRYKKLRSLMHRYRSALAKVYPIPPFLADVLWNQLHVFKVENLVGEIDVFHSSDWSQPPTKSFRVTTIHDLVPLKYPKLSHPKIVAVHNRRFKWVKKEVDRIIVPSKATKRDLVRLGVAENRIVVIPEAPDSIYKPVKKKDVRNLKRKYRISGKYLLCIGVNPRKNLERTVEAFEKVRSNHLKLVIVGYPHLDIRHTRGVRMLGHVSTSEMPILYSGAEALIYPSLYEGFGLPILEAYACKIPVVTSGAGSMQEVAGGAAVLVDPYQVDSIAEGMMKAMKDRRTYVQKGLIQVKRFSWQKTAEMTLDVYKSLIK